jgi:hypothetical protein
MTLEQLGDRDSSWHPVGRYRIYLSAEHRYYGLKDPGQVLPLWVYEGELAPEFLDEQRAWKFYDRLPVAITSLDTLPAEVMESIYRICGLPTPKEGVASTLGAAVVQIGGAEGAAATPAGVGRDPYLPEASAPARRGPFGRLIDLLRRLFGKK